MLPIGAVFGVLTTRGLLKRIHRPLYPAAAPAEKITGASRLASCPVLPPGGEVGGDLFDFLKLPGGRLGIVIGDVTDKGVPAALVMATTCTMLRATGFPLT
ncbi:MAG TPA: SpoIIE family protein phosphatase [Anaerolineales bacterium]